MDCRVVTFAGDEDLNNSTAASSDVTNNAAAPTTEKRRGNAEFYCLLAIRIDELSRFLFPLSFCIFNVLYWSYYTTWSK